jgi:putative phosphoserine phosphatase/1-acylglycerol-3-phosphate O-acyltransferase
MAQTAGERTALSLYHWANQTTEKPSNMTSPNESPATGKSAAFFDLDRTLLLGASGPTISVALREHGLLPERSIPGEGLVFTIFNVIGETLPSMLLTRQGARAAKGWSVKAVEAAGRDLAPRLADEVEPFARATIDEHHQNGRRVVLATTTPYHLVKPFADLMGFDDVLATRYRESADGTFDGSIDGEFVWSRGKARLIQAWARANVVDLGESYAYSDSFFDIPMLSKVGHPVAVNPDPRLLAYAVVRRWPTVWFNAPVGVPKPLGVELQDVVNTVAQPQLWPWLSIELNGLENMPESGPVIMTPNHRSYLDPALVAHAASRRGRPVRFLSKKEVTDAPLVGSLVKALGAIRVDRGSGSEQPMVEAARALGAGELIALFPQGTIPRGPAFFEPELKGRYGAVRLAAQTGSPLLPVGLWGTEKAWPRSSRVPYVMNVADPPTITVTMGEPYHVDPELGIEEATADLMSRIIDLLPAEAREHHRPTEAELALTYPGGRIPE